MKVLNQVCNMIQEPMVIIIILLFTAYFFLTLAIALFLWLNMKSKRNPQSPVNAIIRDE